MISLGRRGLYRLLLLLLLLLRNLGLGEGLAPWWLKLRLRDRKGGIELHYDRCWVPLILILHVVLLLVLLWYYLSIAAIGWQVLIIVRGLGLLVPGMRCQRRCHVGGAMLREKLSLWRHRHVERRFGGWAGAKSI